MTQAPTAAPPLTLHDYQRRAVAHLHANPLAALWLEPGLGKTAIVLRALTPEHLPALVIAPKRVAENVWETEARKWRPDLRVAVAVGTPSRRAAQLARTDASVFVLGRDNARDLGPGHRFRTIVIDESSGVKSPSSQRFRHARKLVKGVPYVWELTGTPAPNSLLDIWSQVALLDGGERLGTGITKYRARYFTEAWRLPNGIVAEYRLRPGAEAAIHRQVSDICLSMRAEDYLELPPVTVNDVTVPIPASARRAYEEIRKDLVLSLDLLGDDAAIHTAANAAVLSGKLSQITAGFIYSDARDGSYSSLHHAKLDALAEIVEGTGSPVLVFYRFIAEAEAIRTAYPTARSVGEPGVIEEWNAGRVPLLLAHPASAGMGLNLQEGGHTIVWTSLPWSLEQYDQANGRLARQGQTHPVIIHRLLTPDSVDHAVVAALDGKTSVQSSLLAALRRKEPI